MVRIDPVVAATETQRPDTSGGIKADIVQVALQARDKGLDWIGVMAAGINAGYKGDMKTLRAAVTAAREMKEAESLVKSDVPKGSHHTDEHNEPVVNPCTARIVVGNRESVVFLQVGDFAATDACNFILIATPEPGPSHRSLQLLLNTADILGSSILVTDNLRRTVSEIDLTEIPV